MSAPFAIRTRVEIADTDFGAVVYYGNYTRLVDRAMLAFRREVGIPLLGADSHFFMVRRLEVDYRSPARFDDLLEIEVRIAEVRRASHVVEFRIAAVEAEPPRLVAEARVVVVGVDPEELRPTPIPPEIGSILRASADAAP